MKVAAATTVPGEYYSGVLLKSGRGVRIREVLRYCGVGAAARERERVCECTSQTQGGCVDDEGGGQNPG